jgi:hypothetical protein
MLSVSCEAQAGVWSCGDGGMGWAWW